jgi:hypothetical protein
MLFPSFYRLRLLKLAANLPDDLRRTQYSIFRAVGEQGQTNESRVPFVVFEPRYVSRFSHDIRQARLLTL